MLYCETQILQIFLLITFIYCHLWCNMVCDGYISDVQVDVLVTTAGGIEEDIIKCLAPTYRGDFSLPGATLRSKGLNRIGNLLVPNENYCKFEDWIIPIFDKMLQEQQTEVTFTVILQEFYAMIMPSWPS